MNLQKLGLKIQQAREENNMSQEQLAIAIGCSQSALSNYEKGKRRMYLAQLEKLSEVLNKPLEYFVEQLPKSRANTSVNRGHDSEFLALMNDIYTLNTEQIAEVRKYMEFLKWNQNREDE
ncbi:MAG: helix-turn-helix transcriptional regulator [Bacillota bacterium]|nr:helix-turn-helix transcriptional regulator [Bacillota bacterium]